MGFGRTFDYTAEDYLAADADLLNGGTIHTMLIMARGTDSGDDAALLWTGDNTSVNHFYGVLVNWPSTGEGVRYIVRGTSNNVVEEDTIDFPDDIFTLVRGTRASGTDMRAGMGTNTTTDTRSQSPDQPVDGTIGGFRDSSDDNYWEGEILWAVIISVDLDPTTDANTIEALSAGASPLHVAKVRDNLVFCCFMNGADPERDLTGNGADMTNNGTTVFDDMAAVAGKFYGERMIAP